MESLDYVFAVGYAIDGIVVVLTESAEAAHLRLFVAGRNNVGCLILMALFEAALSIHFGRYGRTDNIVVLW